MGEEGQTLKITDGNRTSTAVYRQFPVTNYNYYVGPIRVDGKLTIGRSNPYTFTRGVSLYGDISGKGLIDSPNGWLQLMGSNTYEGATCVRNGNAAYGGLALWREEAASTHSAGYFLTNAPLRLVADVRYVGGEKIYDLPPVCWHIDAFTNFEAGVSLKDANVVDTAVTGGMNARMASLKKSGAGELALIANFAITGRTEIVGGTLRLAPASRYSAVPGLWAGIFETNETDTADMVTKLGTGELKLNDVPMYQQYRSDATLSNRVTSSVYLFAKQGKPYWHYLMAPVYCGYIWNRTSAATNVTFAGAIVDAWRIVCRSYTASMYDGQNMDT